MKINLTNGVGIEKNFESDKKIKMRINPDMGMALVTKFLYSNPIQTLTQEYLCNARDASRSTGKEEPVEVTFPTKLEPVLKIRDFGPGISDDKMENVFCILGESDKRKSSDLTGGFGIGAKSAWSYTDSFIIKSFIDGQVSVYLAHIGENQGGTIELITKEQTSEKNGVEIQVNFKDSDIEPFKDSVYRATYFWNIKPVLKGILSEEINKEWLSKKTLLSSKNWEICTSSELPYFLKMNHSNLILVIDNIPYRGAFTNLEAYRKLFTAQSKEECFSLKTNKTLICYLNNNDVDVSASREEINNNDYSKSQVSSILENVSKELKEIIISKRSEAKSVEDIIKLYHEEYSFLNEINTKEIKRDDVLFQLDNRGYILINLLKDKKRVYFDRYYLNGKYGRSYKTVLSKKNFDEIRVQDHCTILNDDASSDFVIRKKLKFLLNNNKEIKNCYVLSEFFSEEVLNILKDELKIVKISDIKIPEENTPKKNKVVRDLSLINIFQVRIKYGEIHTDELKVKMEDIVSDKIVILEERVKNLSFPIRYGDIEISKYDLVSLLSFLIYKGYKICGMSDKNIQKLKVANKNVFSLEESFKLNFELTQEDELTLSEYYYSSKIFLPDWINDLNITGLYEKIADNRFNEVSSFLKRRNYKSYYQGSKLIANTIFKNKFKEKKEEFEKIEKHIKNIESDYLLMKKFPHGEISSFSNEILFYINSKFKEIKK